MVGVREDGAHAAWLLLAMHSLVDPQWQRECLRLLGEAVQAGEAAEQDWAMLLDRVLLTEGRAQVFGTQLTIEHRTYRPERLYAADSVGVLRSRVGLASMRAYLAARSCAGCAPWPMTPHAGRSRR